MRTSCIEMESMRYICVDLACMGARSLASPPRRAARLSLHCLARPCCPDHGMAQGQQTERRPRSLPWRRRRSLDTFQTGSVAADSFALRNTLIFFSQHSDFPELREGDLLGLAMACLAATVCMADMTSCWVLQVELGDWLPKSLE